MDTQPRQKKRPVPLPLKRGHVKKRQGSVTRGNELQRYTHEFVCGGGAATATTATATAYHPPRNPRVAISLCVKETHIAYRIAWADPAEGTSSPPGSTPPVWHATLSLSSTAGAPLAAKRHPGEGATCLFSREFTEESLPAEGVVDTLTGDTLYRVAFAGGVGPGAGGPSPAPLAWERLVRTARPIELHRLLCVGETLAKVSWTHMLEEQSERYSGLSDRQRAARILRDTRLGWGGGARPTPPGAPLLGGTGGRDSRGPAVVIASPRAFAYDLFHVQFEMHSAVFESDPPAEPASDDLGAGLCHRPVEVTTSKMSCDVSQLKPGTVYGVKVQCQDAATLSFGPWSNTKYFSTVYPASLSPVEITPTSVSVAWIPPHQKSIPSVFPEISKLSCFDGAIAESSVALQMQLSLEQVRDERRVTFETASEPQSVFIECTEDRSGGVHKFTGLNPNVVYSAAFQTHSPSHPEYGRRRIKLVVRTKDIPRPKKSVQMMKVEIEEPSGLKEMPLFPPSVSSGGFLGVGDHLGEDSAIHFGLVSIVEPGQQRKSRMSGQMGITVGGSARSVIREAGMADTETPTTALQKSLELGTPPMVLGEEGDEEAEEEEEETDNVPNPSKSVFCIAATECDLTIGWEGDPPDPEKELRLRAKVFSLAPGKTFLPFGFSTETQTKRYTVKDRQKFPPPAPNQDVDDTRRTFEAMLINPTSKSHHLPGLHSDTGYGVKMCALDQETGEWLPWTPPVIMRTAKVAVLEVCSMTHSTITMRLGDGLQTSPIEVKSAVLHAASGAKEEQVLSFPGTSEFTLEGLVGNALYCYKGRKTGGAGSEKKVVPSQSPTAAAMLKTGGFAQDGYSWSDSVFVGLRLVPIDLIPESDTSFSVTWDAKNITCVTVGVLCKFYIILSGLHSKFLEIQELQDLPEDRRHRFTELPPDRYRVRFLHCCVYVDEAPWISMKKHFWSDMYATIALTQQLEILFTRIGDDHICFHGYALSSSVVDTADGERRAIQLPRPYELSPQCFDVAQEKLFKNLAMKLVDLSTGAMDGDVSCIEAAFTTAASSKRASVANKMPVMKTHQVLIKPGPHLACLVTGLTPNTKYTLKIRPELTCGELRYWGNWSTECRFTTTSKVTLDADIIGEDFVRVSCRRQLPFKALYERKEQDYMDKIRNDLFGSATVLSEEEAEKAFEKEKSGAVKRHEAYMQRVAARRKRRRDKATLAAALPPPPPPPQEVSDEEAYDSDPNVSMSPPPVENTFLTDVAPRGIPTLLDDAPAPPPGQPKGQVLLREGDFVDWKTFMGEDRDAREWIARRGERIKKSKELRMQVAFRREELTAQMLMQKRQEYLQRAIEQGIRVSEDVQLGDIPLTPAEEADIEEECAVSSDSSEDDQYHPYLRYVYETPAVTMLQVRAEGKRQPEVHSVPLGDDQYLVEGLTPGVRHVVKARQMTLLRHWTAWSNHISVQTLTDIRVRVHEVGEEYVTLSCSRATTDFENDEEAEEARVVVLKSKGTTITAYQVKTLPGTLGDNIKGGRSRHGSSVAGSGEMHEIRGENIHDKLLVRGLHSDCPYTVCVRVQVAGEFWGHWSEVVTFNTAKPIAVAVSHVSEHSFLVSWERPLVGAARPAQPQLSISANGEYQQTYVEQSVANTVSLWKFQCDGYQYNTEVQDWVKTRYTLTQPAEQSVTELVRLRPDAIYRVSVRSVDSVGLTSPASPALYIVTKPEMSYRVLSLSERHAVVSLSRQERNEETLKLLDIADMLSQRMLTKSLGLGLDPLRREEAKYEEEQAHFSIEDGIDRDFDVTPTVVGSGQGFAADFIDEDAIVVDKSVLVASTSSKDVKVLLNLVPGRTYCCMARGYHEWRATEDVFHTPTWSCWGAPSSFRTLPKLSIALHSLGEDSIDITISKPVDPSYACSHTSSSYQFAVNSSSVAGDWTVSKQCTFRICNLSIDTHYVVFMRNRICLGMTTFDVDAYDDWSYAFSFRTHPVPPTLPILYEHRAKRASDPGPDGATVLGFYWTQASFRDKLALPRFQQVYPDGKYAELAWGELQERLSHLLVVQESQPEQEPEPEAALPKTPPEEKAFLPTAPTPDASPGMKRNNGRPMKGKGRLVMMLTDIPVPYPPQLAALVECTPPDVASLVARLSEFHIHELEIIMAGLLSSKKSEAAAPPTSPASPPSPRMEGEQASQYAWGQEGFGLSHRDMATRIADVVHNSQSGHYSLMDFTKYTGSWKAVAMEASGSEADGRPGLGDDADRRNVSPASDDGDTLLVSGQPPHLREPGCPPLPAGVPSPREAHPKSSAKPSTVFYSLLSTRRYIGFSGFCDDICEPPETAQGGGGAGEVRAPLPMSPALSQPQRRGSFGHFCKEAHEEVEAPLRRRGAQGNVQQVAVAKRQTSGPDEDDLVPLKYCQYADLSKAHSMSELMRGLGAGALVPAGGKSDGGVGRVSTSYVVDTPNRAQTDVFGYRVDAALVSGLEQGDPHSWHTVGLVESSGLARVVLPPGSCVSDFAFRVSARSVEADSFLRQFRSTPFENLWSKPSPCVSWVAPPAPSRCEGLAVAEVLPHTVVLSWQPPHNWTLHNQLQFQVLLKRASIDTKWSRVATTQSLTHTLVNLTVRTGYVAAVRAESTFGGGRISHSVRFTTAVRFTEPVSAPQVFGCNGTNVFSESSHASAAAAASEEGGGDTLLLLQQQPPPSPLPEPPEAGSVGGATAARSAAGFSQKQGSSNCRASRETSRGKGRTAPESDRETSSAGQLQVREAAAAALPPPPPPPPPQAVSVSADDGGMMSALLGSLSPFDNDTESRSQEQEGYWVFPYPRKTDAAPPPGPTPFHLHDCMDALQVKGGSYSDFHRIQSGCCFTLPESVLLGGGGARKKAQEEEDEGDSGRHPHTVQRRRGGVRRRCSASPMEGGVRTLQIGWHNEVGSQGHRGSAASSAGKSRGFSMSIATPEGGQGVPSAAPPAVSYRFDHMACDDDPGATVHQYKPPSGEALLISCVRRSASPPRRVMFLGLPKPPPAVAEAATPFDAEDTAERESFSAFSQSDQPKEGDQFEGMPGGAQQGPRSVTWIDPPTTPGGIEGSNAVRHDSTVSEPFGAGTAEGRMRLRQRRASSLTGEGLRSRDLSIDTLDTSSSATGDPQMPIPTATRGSTSSQGSIWGGASPRSSSASSRRASPATSPNGLPGGSGSGSFEGVSPRRGPGTPLKQALLATPEEKVSFSPIDPSQEIPENEGSGRGNGGGGGGGGGSRTLPVFLVSSPSSKDVTEGGVLSPGELGAAGVAPPGARRVSLVFREELGPEPDTADLGEDRVELGGAGEAYQRDEPPLLLGTPRSSADGGLFGGRGSSLKDSETTPLSPPLIPLPPPVVAAEGGAGSPEWRWGGGSGSFDSASRERPTPSPGPATPLAVRMIARVTKFANSQEALTGFTDEAGASPRSPIGDLRGGGVAFSPSSAGVSPAPSPRAGGVGSPRRGSRADAASPPLSPNPPHREDDGRGRGRSSPLDEGQSNPQCQKGARGSSAGRGEKGSPTSRRSSQRRVWKRASVGHRRGKGPPSPLLLTVAEAAVLSQGETMADALFALPEGGGGGVGDATRHPHRRRRPQSAGIAGAAVRPASSPPGAGLLWREGQAGLSELHHHHRHRHRHHLLTSTSPVGAVLLSPFSAGSPCGGVGGVFGWGGQQQYHRGRHVPKPAPADPRVERDIGVLLGGGGVAASAVGAASAAKQGPVGGLGGGGAPPGWQKGQPVFPQQQQALQQHPPLSSTASELRRVFGGPPVGLGSQVAPKGGPVSQHQHQQQQHGGPPCVQLLLPPPPGGAAPQQRGRSQAKSSLGLSALSGGESMFSDSWLTDMLPSTSGDDTPSLAGGAAPAAKPQGKSRGRRSRCDGGGGGGGDEVLDTRTATHSQPQPPAMPRTRCAAVRGGGVKFCTKMVSSVAGAGLPESWSVDAKIPSRRGGPSFTRIRR